MGIIDWAAGGYRNQPVEPLTEKDLIAAYPPRHGESCHCVLCEMDRKLVESARVALFGSTSSTSLDVPKVESEEHR